MTLTRRSLLQGAMAGVALPWWLGGDRRRSAEAQDLINYAISDLAPGSVLDAHTHVVGIGTGGSGCWVNPHMLEPIKHPVNYGRFMVYRKAAGIEDIDHADQEFVAVLADRVAAMPMPVKALIFAFDKIYDEAGQPQDGITEFYTPNSHVCQVAQDYPHLVPVASIHPYRADAIEALHAAVEAGAVAIKWLPNAQRMDPSSPLCDAFYQAMVDLNLPLITHAGYERAVEADDAQALGDPQRLLRPLDAGMRIIVAHCASQGSYPDLSHPQHQERSSFELFLRMMDMPEYAQSLWGEISATTLVDRVGRLLPELLRRQDLHPRLINGSDYPIPAIDPLISTWQIVASDLIDSEHRRPLSELWDENPLIFDFVLKRCLRLEHDPQARFPASVFQPPSSLFPRVQL
jgi:predicted TIM-barrel fold metal-dependent hydrolase